MAGTWCPTLGEGYRDACDMGLSFFLLPLATSFAAWGETGTLHPDAEHWYEEAEDHTRALLVAY